jgi:hypothetical protein
MPGKYLRGAFVEFRSGFLAPVPNVIVFQYNPETITHSWTPGAPTGDGSEGGQNDPLGVGGDPGEEFSFTLEMDAGDTIADGIAPASALAASAGVYPRLAALELLMFASPSTLGDLLSGSLSAAAGTVAGAAGGAAAGALAGAAGSLIGAIAGVHRQVPLSEVPAVLFVWGPGRIVPVRVTRLNVTEKLYDSTLLIPTHAEVEVGLQVLTQQDINGVQSKLVRGLLNTAYNYMSNLRNGLAVDNLVNSTDSIIGMIPF